MSYPQAKTVPTLTVPTSQNEGQLGTVWGKQIQTTVPPSFLVDHRENIPGRDTRDTFLLAICNSKWLLVDHTKTLMQLLHEKKNYKKLSLLSLTASFIHRQVTHA